MVQVEFATRRSNSAELTRALVPSVYIEAAKPHLSPRHSVITHKKDNPRHLYDPVNQPDRFVIHGYREITPGFKIKRLVAFIHRPCNALIKQRKRTANRRDMDRKIRAIQHQNFRAE